jgi:hypothetical protein
MNDEPEDLDQYESVGPYLPAETLEDVEVHFITRLEEHIGRVPCDAEVTVFAHNILCYDRKRQYVFWKGKLLFYTDLV